tara:strand:+ start:89 stop:325 length:237 start_codon:yes stop_codon:yes gene_type:complete
MKITKATLKRIIKEELAYINESIEGAKLKAQMSAWKLYAQDHGSKPEFPHPKGEYASEAACKERNKKRLGKGRAQQPC